MLVNNAGIYPGAATADADEETFDRVYAVNVKAPFFLTAVIVPAMAAAGGGRRAAGGGAIINLGLWIVRLGIAIGALYSSTKGAAGTAGSPDAIASAAGQLASDEASFVHGIVLDVDGGRTTTAVIAA